MSSPEAIRIVTISVRIVTIAVRITVGPVVPVVAVPVIGGIVAVPVAFAVRRAACQHTCQKKRQPSRSDFWIHGITSVLSLNKV